MSQRITAARKLVMARDDAGMKQLLQEWVNIGVSQETAHQDLVRIWEELSVERNDKELDFLANWIDVVVGHVGPGALIWPEKKGPKA
jgi:hypothetical protein